MWVQTLLRQLKNSLGLWAGPGDERNILLLIIVSKKCPRLEYSGAFT